jgi:hypothetical protein
MKHRAFGFDRTCTCARRHAVIGASSATGRAYPRRARGDRTRELDAFGTTKQHCAFGACESHRRQSGGTRYSSGMHCALCKEMLALRLQDGGQTVT